jgi:hypothetical protein
MILLTSCRLQELEVSFCDQMTDKGLLEGIGPLQDLYSLRLKRGHNLTAPGLSTFLHRPAMACIVCLNLSECSSLDDHGLEGIANRCNYFSIFTCLNTVVSCLREEHKLQVFKNNVTRKIFGSNRDEVSWQFSIVHNEEHCDLYSSPCIVGALKW